MDIKKETEAIEQVVAALDELEPAARDRVLRYALQALGLAHESSRGFEDIPREPKPQEEPTPSPSITDIRSLKEEKQPATANEMAALVAYYLAELAPEEDRHESINASDLEKYFKQAGYPLPSRMRNVLINAASAGYFDSVSRGRYRLNPVGYNLVTHGLPSSGPVRADAPVRRKPSSGRKKASSGGRKGASKNTAKKGVSKKSSRRRSG